MTTEKLTLQNQGVCMLKAIVCGAMLSLLFVGCSQELPEQNLLECKSKEDKITGCVERRYYENG